MSSPLKQLANCPADPEWHKQNRHGGEAENAGHGFSCGAGYHHLRHGREQAAAHALKG
jgi:hypothetical protein